MYLWRIKLKRTSKKSKKFIMNKEEATALNRLQQEAIKKLAEVKK